MATKLQRLVKGQAPTLLDADRANELIDAVNGLIQSKGSNGIKVIVEDSGRLDVSLDFNLDEIQTALCINGVLFNAIVNGQIINEIEQ